MSDSLTKRKFIYIYEIINIIEVYGTLTDYTAAEKRY